MPKGDNPNSRKNLQKFGSEREPRKAGSKGGKASVESRRASASLTESLKRQLTPDLMDDITLMLIRRAKQGNLKAYELLRDQMGEKPTEKIAVSTVNEESLDRLQEAIKKRQSNEKADTVTD